MFFRSFPLFLATSISISVQAAPAPRVLPPATRAQIATLLRAPEMQSAHIGIAIVALGETATAAQSAVKSYDAGAQPLLFGHQETKRFLPASNMKLFTAAWVLDRIKPATRLQTTVLSAPVEFAEEGIWPRTLPDPVVLTLVGGGDPSFGLDGVENLASQIAKLNPSAVVVRAQNAIGGDELSGENGGNRYPDGWTLDDALWYYGAPVTGLAFERNQIDVTLTGTAPGQGAKLEMKPGSIEILSPTKDVAPEQILAFNTFNLVTTVEKGDPRAGSVSWERGDNRSPLGGTLTLRGFLAPGQSVSEGVAVPDPREWARLQFEAALRRHGVRVLAAGGFTTGKSQVVATHDSAPVGTLLKRFLKNSDNLYGEMLLRRAALSSTKANAVGKPDFQIASTGSAALAHGEMAEWLKRENVPTRGLRFSDGSGLSRYNLVTPLAVARLLGAAQKTVGAREFYDALPVAGVDGTLKNRMKNTAASGNVRAKTGTFSIVNCLSGYVTTRDGQRLAVSILTNGAENGEFVRNWQGRIFESLANAQLK